MHQANLRINESVQKILGLPDAKVFNNIQKYGNTTAATLPLVYDEAVADGPDRPGRRSSASRPSAPASTGARRSRASEPASLSRSFASASAGSAVGLKPAAGARPRSRPT